MPTTDRYSLAPLEFAAVRARLGSFAETAMGRALVARLAPAPVAAESRERLARAAEAMALRRGGSPPSLAGAEDLRLHLEHLAAGGRPLEPADLAGAARTLRQCEEARDRLRDLAAAAPRLAAVGSAIPELGDLAGAIERAVDSRGEVLDTASPRLAEARGRLRAVQGEVERALERIVANPEIRRILHAPKPTYRHERPVLAVKAEHRHRVPGLLLDRSTTGGTVYIEPEGVVELGNAVAEIGLQIAREVAAILLELSRLFLASRERVRRAVDQMAELDLAFATGAYGEAQDGVVPEIIEGRRLRLAGARHPKLLDRDPDAAGGRSHESAVPIDVELGGEFDLLVITGPNTGGKTVALKTVGLLAAMALAGIPVPARAAEIPAFDGIFVDVGDEQEISQSLSTFSSHMVRVARALRGATRDSLVLLDEVGAGTDPADGAALGEAVLEHLLARGVRAIATTHLGRLKELAYREPRAENATVEFDPATLLPKYRLILGIPGTSQALAVARRVGLPEAVLERAERGLERRDPRVEEMVLAVQAARVEADAARRRAEETLEDAARARGEVAARAAELEGRALALRAEAQRQVDEALHRLRAAVRDGLEPLAAGAPKPFDARLRAFREQLESALASEPIEAKREAFLASLKRDAVVYVPKFRRRCPVRKVSRDRRVVTVLVGELPTEVRFDEVTWYEVL